MSSRGVLERSSWLLDWERLSQYGSRISPCRATRSPFGFEMTLDKDVRRILVKSDYAVIVLLFKCIVHDLHSLTSSLYDCHHLISQFDQCDLSHIYKEMNIAADGLAN